MRKEAEFVVKLEDLFHIAHMEAFKLNKIPKESLTLDQREKSVLASWAQWEGLVYQGDAGERVG